MSFVYFGNNRHLNTWRTDKPANSKTMTSISTAKLRDTLARAPRNSAYARHIQKCLQYVDYYGGSVPSVSKGKTERDLLEQEFQFLRDDGHDEMDSGRQDTAKEIAKKYYDNLFREFALIDLSRWREGQVALRWRTKQEVLQGLGQFTCASLTCPRHTAPTEDPPEFSLDSEEGDGMIPLETIEMNFGYVEKGVKKNALVKVCVCEKCASKLHKVKGSSKEQQSRRKDRSREREREEKKSRERRERRHRRHEEDEDVSSRSKHRRHEEERDYHRSRGDEASEDKTRGHRDDRKSRHDISRDQGEREERRYDRSRHSRWSRSRSPVHRPD
ncbi:hypothetical protein AA313_de0201944 [Arthrobotrys entomopaga]|nr:hypothetical protein AA313_de0201944 [Arthrobotrys entomopaga]